MKKTLLKYLCVASIGCAFALSSFAQKLDSLPVGNAEQQRDSAQIDQLYQQALKEISFHDFANAEEHLDQVLHLDSTHGAALFELTRIYFSQNKYEEAARVAKRAAAINPTNITYWIALADIYKTTKNYAELLPVFDHIIQLKPDEDRYYLDKAYTLTLSNKYQKALSLYDEIEEKFGVNERVYSGRQLVYIKQNKPKKAISEIKSYIQKKPKDSKGYIMLANVYLDLKEPKESLNVLEKAENSFPKDAYIPLTKADAYQQLKSDKDVFIQLKKAFSYKTLDLEPKINVLLNVFNDFPKEQALMMSDALSKVLIETHPQKANAYAIYGDILLQQNKTEDALVQFKRALQINPKLEMVWEQVLQTEVATGKYIDAQNDGKKALALIPNQPVALLFTGYAYLLDRNYREARPYLEGALNNVDTKDTKMLLQIYSSLGDLYHALDMHDVSDVAYEEALAIDSNNAYILNNYAYYLSLRKENLEKAASFSKKSNEISPGNSSYQDTYAWVLFQQGNYSEALNWIINALQSTKSASATLFEHHGDILFKLGNKTEAMNQWGKARKIAIANGENVEKLNKKIKNKTYVE